MKVTIQLPEDTTFSGGSGHNGPRPPILMPSLTLTPRGHLLFTVADDALQPPAALSRRLESAFARGSGHGLLELGAAEVGTALPADFGYWRDFAARLVTAICTHPDLDAHHAPIPAPALGELEALAAAAPPMTGAEYLTASVLETLWTEIAAAFRSELAESKASVQDVSPAQEPGVASRRPRPLQPRREPPRRRGAVRVPGDLHDALSAQAKAQHLPLGRALSEYAGAANKPRLLSLLLPVQRAAAECPWLKTMVEAGEIYHPLRWTPAEAFQLLTDVPRLEAAGVIVRVPTAWRANRPPRPQVTATVGGKPPSGLGTDALLDFQMGVRLDGEPLTKAEIEHCSPRRTACTWCADAGSRSIARDSAGCSTSSERSRRPPRRTASPSPRRCACSPARTCQATSLRPPRPTGRASSPGRGWRRRSPAFAIPPNWRARSRRRAEGDAAALSAGRRALAAPAVQPRPRRVPRRRHGPRQDDAGAGAAAGAAKHGATRRRRGAPASWSRRRRCWPTGRRRSSASRRPLTALVAHPSAMTGAELKALDRDRSPASTS